VGESGLNNGRNTESSREQQRSNNGGNKISWRCASKFMRRLIFRSGRLAPLDGGSSRRSGVMRLCSSEQPAHISLIRRRSRSIVSRAPASSRNPRCPAPDNRPNVFDIGQEIEAAVTNRLTAGPSISAGPPSEPVGHVARPRANTVAPHHQKTTTYRGVLTWHASCKPQDIDRETRNVLIGR
jgi:hypothetical protein